MEDVAALTGLGQAAVLVAVGLVFGLIAERQQLCTMGAVADVVIFGSWRRARLWASMIGGAALLSTVAMVVGLMPAVLTAPTAGTVTLSLIGGLSFGMGMVLAGGCVSRAWLRASSGSLRAFVVLAIAALSAWPSAALVGSAQVAAGVPIPPVLLGAVGLAFLGWVLFDGRARARPGAVLAMVGLGALLVCATLTSSSGLRFLPEAGLPSAGGAIGALSLLVGVGVGSALSAAAAGRFRLDLALGGTDAGRTYGGALLMGLGGGLIGGCTLAVGTFGVAQLAPTAWVALAGMVLGAAVILKMLLAGGPGTLWQRVARRLAGGAA